MAGRPTSFTPELGKEICMRMADGESVRQIARDDNMPCRRAINNWIFKAKETDAPEELKVFMHQYREAEMLRAEEMFDEMADIAHDGSNDWMDRETKSGGVVEVLNSEHVQRSKLRIDTMKWKLSKMIPKKYGDKIQQEISGTVTTMTAHEKMMLDMIEKNENRKK